MSKLRIICIIFLYVISIFSKNLHKLKIKNERSSLKINDDCCLYPCRYLQVEVSWSQSLGLSVEWDGQTFASSTYTMLKQTTAGNSDLIIGSASSDFCWLGMTIGGIEIFSAPRPVLDVKQVISGTHLGSCWANHWW